MSGADSFHYEELAGGTIRVSQPSHQEPIASAPYEDSRVHYGVIRDDGSGGLVQDNGATAFTGRSVLATAKNNAGPTTNYRGDDVTVCLIPGDESSRTSIRTAALLGAIRKVDDNGNYADLSPEQAPPQSQWTQETPQQQTVPAAHELFEDGAEADWAADIDPLPQPAYEGAMARYASAVVSDDPAAFDRIARSLASEAGIPPELAEQYVDNGYALFEGQVSKVAQAAGIGADRKEAFYSWCQKSKPQQLQRAVQELTNVRRLDVFRSLAAEFVRTKR